MSERAVLLMQEALSRPLEDEEVMAFVDFSDTRMLMEVAAILRDRGHQNTVSYSRKVFIPLTHLCRDVCHYCTFAQVPRKIKAPYLTPEEVLKIAEDGAKAGCKEALFTLGDKPELRYKAARDGLKVGVCGEHGGDPASVAFFHGVGLDYVSCSPFRVPIARLAAAQAAIAEGA